MILKYLKHKKNSMNAVAVQGLFPLNSYTITEPCYIRVCEQKILVYNNFTTRETA